MGIDKFFRKSIATIFVGAMLFSCTKPQAEMLGQGIPEDVVDEEAFDIEVLYSDSGHIRLKLNAPEIARFSSLTDPYTEYPQGLIVLFYNDSGKVTTELSAEYAIQYPNKGLTEAQKNVVVINEKGEKLQTEKLIWKEQEKLIFTEEFVRITTETEQLTGYGLEANQTFSWYKIKKPAGIIDLTEDESSN